MRALYVTSEVFPLAKTGGLADVSAALPKALSDIGVDVRLLLPGYPQALEGASELREMAKLDGLGALLSVGPVRLYSAQLPGSGVPVLLIDCPPLYDRVGGIYQDAGGGDWADNALRFGLLNHVAAMATAGAVPGHDWRPDIVHANDWHAGLVPLLIASDAPGRPQSVLTIHNLAYQGLFAAQELERLALPPDERSRASLEFYGRLSFLKAGIEWADALTTVSPTYAKEILTPEYGCGLDGLLRGRAAHLSGILNGVDYRIWDPGSDPFIPYTFTHRKIAPKHACKSALQAELGLERSADAPLMVFMSRLAHQKMPDIVLEALPPLIEDGAQFALVAAGDPAYEAGFRALESHYPGRVATEIGYSEPLAHRLLAGADILLHPSRFEPCGLTPLYAMRYGAIPIVRKSGGLADSVADASTQSLDRRTATGFFFEAPTAEALIECARRALGMYWQPILWRKIRRSAMEQDFSWRSSAKAYLELYSALCGAADEAPLEEETEKLLA